jgi:hypothetical protein
MGRSTPPLRASFTKAVARLRRRLQQALTDRGRREAFDDLVKAWSSELGAMSYAESFTLTDLMLLAASIDNRRLITSLRGRLRDLKLEVESMEDAMDDGEGYG